MGAAAATPFEMRAGVNDGSLTERIQEKGDLPSPSPVNGGRGVAPPPVPQGPSHPAVPTAHITVVIHISAEPITIETGAPRPGPMQILTLLSKSVALRRVGLPPRPVTNPTPHLAAPPTKVVDTITHHLPLKRTRTSPFPPHTPGSTFSMKSVVCACRLWRGLHPPSSPWNRPTSPSYCQCHDDTNN